MGGNGNQNNKALLNVHDAAVFLGRSEAALRGLIRRRALPFRWHGRKIVFLRDELIAFINALPGPRLSDFQK